MRVGTNEAKGTQLNGFARHRIIIPVYIPKLDGYFKHSLEILKLCLESLRITTAGNQASVTIISNGSAPEVIAEIERCYGAGWIDQFLLNRENRGKVDALVAAARGAFEPLITISDCDVLFKTGWLEQVERIFHDFPECGFASPAPNPIFGWVHTSATTLGAVARRELAFEKVVPDIDLDRFARSIGRPDLFRAEHRRAQMIVRRGAAKACVGSGHFVFTTRREVVSRYPHNPCLKALGGGSPRLLDTPPDQLGYWRLSTTRAYAYHMGNVPENWMYDELRECRATVSELPSAPAEAFTARLPWTSSLPWTARKLLARVLKKSYSFRTRAALPPARAINSPS